MEGGPYVHEKLLLPFIFAPILFDTLTKETHKCQFISRSECIWGMLKANKDVCELAVTAT